MEKIKNLTVLTRLNHEGSDISSTSKNKKRRNAKKKLRTKLSQILKQLKHQNVVLFSITWELKGSFEAGVVDAMSWKGNLEEDMDELDSMDLKESSWSYLKNKGNENEMWCFCGIEGIEFAYSCIKEDSDGWPKIQCLLGIRSFMGKNRGLEVAISQFLQPHISFQNLNIKPLLNATKIENCLRDMFENYNINYATHGFWHYSRQFLDVYQPLWDYIIDNKLPFYNDPLKILPGKYWEIEGFVPLKIDQRTEKEQILIYLWNLYLTLNKMVVDQNKIYKKTDDSRYSYEYIGDLNWLKDNTQWILEDLKKRFPIQFHQLNLFSFVHLTIRNSLEFVNYYPQCLGQCPISWEFIEFQDGIYWIQYDCFLPFSKYEKELAELQLRIGRCFPYKYRSLKSRITKNKFSIHKFLNDQFTVEEIESFCIDFGRFIMQTPNTLTGKEKNASIFAMNNSTLLNRFHVISDVSFIDIDSSLKQSQRLEKNELTRILNLERIEIAMVFLTCFSAVSNSVGIKKIRSSSVKKLLSKVKANVSSMKFKTVL